MFPTGHKSHGSERQGKNWFHVVLKNPIILLSQIKK